jgi:ABC-type transport system involved in multi-copper enzyme maturation permease subunit
MYKLFSVEVFKIRRQALTWVLLGITLGFFAGSMLLAFVELQHSDSLPAGWIEPVLAAATLPGAFYTDLLMVRSLTNILVVFFSAQVFGNDRATGISRILIGHGLSRPRHLLSKGTAMLVALILAWSLCFLIILVVGSYVTHIVEGGFHWQSRFWSDIFRVIAGNSLHQLVLACIVCLFVVIFSSRFIGAAGGLLYLFLLERAVPGLFIKLDLLGLVPYTSLHASQILVDPNIAVISLEFLRAVLVLISWSAIAIVVAIKVYKRMDIT